MRLSYLAAAAALAVAATAPAHATVQFVNGITIPGTLLDATGGATVNDGRVGFFSDIYYDPNRNEWWGLSDRGPGGGTLNYDTRVNRFTIDINPTTGAISNFQVVETVKFSAGGVNFNGIAPSPASVLGKALDPEGFVVNPKTGNFLVSDEYGPSVYEFNRSGELIKTYTTPANLRPRAADGTPNYASDAGNVAGKRTNRGFEGLSITPDGKYAYAVLQSPTLNEGGAAQTGSYARIVKFDTETGLAVAQYAYKMDRTGQGQGISSLVAINDNEVLVLERNNRGVGVGATLATADKAVYKVDLSQATDVSDVALPADGSTLPAGVKAVLKEGKLIDLDANTLAELGNKSPEKWEGLAIGPKLADGSFFVLAGTDNDYSVTQNADGLQFDVYFRFSDADPFATSIQCPLGQTTGCSGASTTLLDGYALLPGVLHAYKVSADELAGYMAPVPEPRSWAMTLAGVGAIATGAYRRRRTAGKAE
ncbi:MAG: esterase-like activity of phytase family protein [Aquabacterium sp.]|nr:MAG: esterase-like activity of phytase family protein [Aquabacterium sp.]